MPQTRATRAIRGIVVGAFATFVALASHAIAGGEVAGWLGVVAPLVLSVMVSTLLSGRRLSLIRLSISVAVSQVFFHTLFVLGNPAPTTGGHTANGHGHHHHHHGITTMSPVGPVDQSHLEPAMWLGHLAAAAITVSVLFFSQALFAGIAAIAGRVSGWFSRALGWTVVIRPVTEVAPAGFVEHHAHTLPLGVFPSVTSLRGPPSFAG